MDDEDRYTRITLRIPRELHAQLSTEADRTSKSLNAEIVGRLQKSFDFASPVDEMLVDGVNLVQLRKDLEYRQDMLEKARQRFEAARLRHELLAGQFEFTRRTRDPEVSDYARQLRDKMDEAEHEFRAALDELQACETEVARLRTMHNEVQEARYRFLEAKGAKGVRQAKV